MPGVKLLLVILLAAPPAFADGWETLHPGVQYMTFRDGAGQAFRLDLAKVRLRIASAEGREEVADLARGTGALLAVNGGFFDGDGRPLGLLVSGGRELSRLRRADWGVLTIDLTGVASVVHVRDFRRTKGLDFALEAGPRLVVAGKPLHLKDQSDPRTAIGVRPGGRELVLVVVERSVSLTDLARDLAETFGCPDALNLDGGSSTQLWATSPRVKAVSARPVANAVLVVPR